MKYKGNFFLTNFNIKLMGASKEVYINYLSASGNSTMCRHPSITMPAKVKTMATRKGTAALYLHMCSERKHLCRKKIIICVTSYAPPPPPPPPPPPTHTHTHTQTISEHLHPQLIAHSPSRFYSLLWCHGT